MCGLGLIGCNVFGTDWACVVCGLGLIGCSVWFGTDWACVVCALGLIGCSLWFGTDGVEAGLRLKDQTPASYFRRVLFYSLLSVTLTVAVDFIIYE